MSAFIFDTRGFRAVMNFQFCRVENEIEFGPGATSASETAQVPQEDMVKFRET